VTKSQNKDLGLLKGGKEAGWRREISIAEIGRNGGAWFVEMKRDGKLS